PPRGSRGQGNGAGSGSWVHHFGVGIRLNTRRAVTQPGRGPRRKAARQPAGARRKPVSAVPENALTSRFAVFAGYGVEMSVRSGGRGKRPTFTDLEALQFHSQGRPGKLEVVATKPMATQRDLSLAYSPGVAIPVLAIAEDEGRAFDYTTKGNFV